MQHMNDDMDELFRKAAGEYPLDTRNADWNKIAGRLRDDTAPTVTAKQRYRRFGWLLLLVPLAFVVMQYGSKILPGSVDRIAAEMEASEQNSSEANSSEANSSEANQSETNPAETNESTTNGLKPNAPKTNASESNAPETKGLKKSIPSAENKLRAESGSSEPHDIPSGNSGDLKVSPGSGANSTKPGLTKSQSAQDNLVHNNDKTTASTGPVLVGGHKPAKKPLVNAKAELPGTNQLSGRVETPDQSLPGGESSSNAEVTGYELSAYNKSMSLSREQPIISAVKFPLLTKLEAGAMSKQANSNSNGFYIGAIIGLDVSAVKLQRFSGLGFHYGGTIGYQFAKRLSVEAGLYAAKKYYYTKGEYFDKGKMVVSPSSTILSVDGACIMFEIPVSIKYDIHNTYKTNFFVTGGFSSYIMKEENYAMLYRYNSSGTTAVHDYTYKNSSRNFFAALRLTAGYALKLPKSFNLRLEPYVNIPVNGVGYGKLNLMSAGVNAGIFKRIF